MTVLVGVLCADGVVIGSDSSATFAAGQFRTIEQPAQKTFLVGDDVIFAITGSAGLGQRFGCVLENTRSLPEWQQAERLAIGNTICRRMIEDMRTTFMQPGSFGALVAFHCCDGFHLCEFAIEDFQPEFKTPKSWFVSLGSGQPITDPFLGLLARTLFRDAQPRLSEGVFAVTWALDNAIKLNTGGINGPPQVAVLRHDGPTGTFRAFVLSDDELGEHSDNVKGAEEYLASYRDHVSGGPQTPPPPAPPAPPGV